MAEVPEGSLMQRAAGALAVCVAELVPAGVYGARVALLVGPGNNGGDALWAGARLARRGARVDALLLSESAHPDGLAALTACRRPQPPGRICTSWCSESRTNLLARGAANEVRGSRADVVVDGVLGIGGRAGLAELPAPLLDLVPESAVVVAVDLPSGVDPETGEAPADQVWADVTVTFGVAKPGLFLPPADRAAGVVRVVDIGLGPHLPDLDPPSSSGSRPTRPPTGRCPGRRTTSTREACSGSWPGARRTPELPCSVLEPRCARARGWCAMSGRNRRPTWCAPGGPRWCRAPAGCRPGSSGRASTRTPIPTSGRPRWPLWTRVGPPWWTRVRWPVLPGPGRSAPTLLTPHAGELARLLTERAGAAVPRADVEARPLAHARRASELTGATVLLKGATCVLVAPDGRVRTVPDGPGWLATAGSGDVLAGLAGALLAAGLDPFDAGTMAVVVHGLAAGVANPGGPIHAEGLLHALPATIAALISRAALRRRPLTDWPR